MNDYGIYEAAAELGYASTYLRDMARRRMIRARKGRGGAWRIPAAEVERLRRLGGPIARRTALVACAAPDCRVVFKADCRSGQRFCSERCQHRAYMRRYREAA